MIAYDHDRLVRELSDILLTDPAIGHIHFYIGNTGRIHVSGKQLRETGALVRSERITIKIDRSALEKAGAEAQYQAGPNEIVLPPDWIHDRQNDSAAKYVLSPEALNPDPGVFRDTKQNRAMFVHESTHALLDKRGLKVLNVRNEAAAWFAGAVYAYHSGALSSLLASQVYSKHPLWDAANSVAEQHELYKRWGVTLRRAELLPLLKMINKHYDYLPGSRGRLDGIDDD